MQTFASKHRTPGGGTRKPGMPVYHAGGNRQRATIRRILTSAGAQAKLTVGAPNDVYEQEADRVAEAVMRVPAPLDRPASPGKAEAAPPSAKNAIQSRSATGPAILLRPQPSVGRWEATAPPEIAGSQGPGEPLSSAERTFFEPRLGYDLRQVRIHTDPVAAQAAQALNAQAFTLGSDISFNTGKYVPGSMRGRRLLAHELTHVIQQGFGRTQRMLQCQASVDGWVFNTGKTSSDNCSSYATHGKLGLDSGFYAARSGMFPDLEHAKTNGMELQAFIGNHTANTTYDFKRVMERNVWERSSPGAKWTEVPNQYRNPGTDDDPRDDDECLNPIAYQLLPNKHYIYVIDHPGLNPKTLSSTATEAVYKASFTESVEITQAGTPTVDPRSIDWHSITWITKSSNAWNVDKSKSEIDLGSEKIGHTGP
jgi:hypothetical protein